MDLFFLSIFNRELYTDQLTQVLNIKIDIGSIVSIFFIFSYLFRRFIEVFNNEFIQMT